MEEPEILNFWCLILDGWDGEKVDRGWRAPTGSGRVTRDEQPATKYPKRATEDPPSPVCHLRTNLSSSRNLTLAGCRRLGRGGRGRDGEFAENATGEVLVDLVMPGDGLADFGLGLLVPVVFAAVPEEDGAGLIDFLDEFAPLQAAASSAWRRTQGMVPPRRSRWRSRRCSLRSWRDSPWVT